MKTSTFKLLFVGLFISFLCSCQDNILSEDYTLTNESAETRTEQISNFDYYWFNGEKKYIRQVENKSFVLFKTNDEKKLLTTLLKTKANCSIDIKEYDYSGTDMSGTTAKTFLNYKWLEVNINYKELQDNPLIAYCAPYYSIESGEEFPLTNLVYVILKNDGDLYLLEDKAKEYNLSLIGKFIGFPRLYIVACTNESKGNAIEIANALYESKLFHHSEPVFISAFPQSTDPMYSNQWNLKNTGQYGSAYSGYDINYENALSLMPSSSNIKIGVIDTGVEITHPDISVTTFSWNAVTNSSPNQVYTSHGTAVAGVISGITNNSIGIAGIASGFDVMPFSVNFDNTNVLAHIAASIIKATDMGVSVINGSWMLTESTLIEEAINYAIKNGRNGKGCVLAICAGNHNLSSLCYPASHTPETDIISVGAISYDGKRKSTSSPDGMTDWGSDYGIGLDVMAPGVLIRSTIPNSSYTTNFWGTSAAAPHVAAIAAQVLSKNPYLSYKDVAFIISRSANKQLPGYSFNTNKIGGMWNTQVGYGLLDAYAAISLAQSSNNSGSAYIIGQSSITANSNGYAGVTLTAYPNSNYSYIWSGKFTGECDRWYISPTGTNEDGAIANISVYLNPNQTGGSLVITCRIFNGTTYIGTANHYLTIIP